MILLPDEALVSIFAFVGGGAGPGNEESPPQSLRNTITIEEARELDENLTSVCNRWTAVYNANKHRILAPLRIDNLEYCTEDDVSWIQHNQAKVGYMEFRVWNLPVWCFLYRVAPARMVNQRVATETIHLSLGLQAFMKGNDMTHLVHFHIQFWRDFAEGERTILKSFILAECPLLQKCWEDSQFNSARFFHFFQVGNNKRKRGDRI